MGVEGVVLGPFVLQSLLGRGAAGEVFLARHTEQRADVAVKVLSRRDGWEPKHLRRFRTEVKAMASLHHHGVVMVLDYGEVTEGVSRGSGGALSVGSPYFAMEYAPYGSLHGVGGTLPFQSIRSILLVILESLAHAHSRGLIHRDIKPANVLVFGQTPGRPDLKLTDFGIVLAAADREREGRVENSMGTPQYMAPEQFRGVWRDYGPWTDLYALGCIAYELASGEVPFAADTFLEHAYKHTRMDRPDLPDDGRYPEAFQAWIERMMHIDLQHRYVRAADAAWALQQIPCEFDASIPVLPRLPLRTTDDKLPLEAAQTSLGSDPSLPWSLVTLSGEHALLVTRELRADDHAPAGAHAGHAGHVGGTRLEDVPPMHLTWRTETPPRRSMHLLGAGLGIYDVRTVPFVGREKERDLIWEQLRRTRASERAHALVLQGAAGVGKSRLADWVCARSHELGAASPLKAFHDRNSGADQGISRMLASHLRCLGLKYEEATGRVSRLLRRYGPQGDTYLMESLVALMEPEGETPGKRALPREERYAALLSWMTYRAYGRPLMIWLDDVQWGRDALDFVLYAMNAPKCGALLFLLTARDETLAQRAVERFKLAEILRHSRAHRVDLQPLGEDENAVLVGDLLGMEPTLARHVETQAGGNPMYAIELVSDWVQRDILRVGEAGFSLREGERADLPDDLYGIAAGRLEYALDGRAAAVRSALEIAAVMGLFVDASQWRAIGMATGVEDPARVGNSLADEGVFVVEEGGYGFAHGVMAETLERGARESGCWEAHNRVCAGILEEGDRWRRGMALRAARHLLAAGEDERALPVLLDAAEELMREGSYGDAIDVLLTRDVAIEGMRYPGNHVARYQSRVLRARLLILQGALKESKGIALTIVERGAMSTDAHRQVGARALQCLGDIARIRGEWDAAGTYYRAAMDHFTQRGHQHGQWETLSGMAEAEVQSGGLDVARVLYGRVQGIGEDLGDPYPVAVALLGLGRCAMQSGAMNDAIEAFQGALGMFESSGARSAAVDCVHAMGDVHRMQGMHAEARRHYEKALSFYEAIGSGQVAHVQLSAAILHLDREEYGEATGLLGGCIQVFGSTGERDDIGRTHAALLACAAGRGDWEGFDAHLAVATQELEGTRRVDRDVAHCFERAAHCAANAGFQERNARAQAFVEAQLERLGSHERE